MPSRRKQIAMTDGELQRFLDEQRVLVLATAGPDGRPHLTALWYIVRDGQPWIFTYARSQKVRNLERSAQATLLVESGSQYAELRGAMLYADATIHRDLEAVSAVAEELFVRYEGSAGNRESLDEGARQALRAQAAKRVAVQFSPTRVVSWDHAKIAETH